MGGNAFAKYTPAVSTPRLSPEQYYLVRDALITKLSAHFRHIAVPIEGPEKTSFGDIDIMLTGPLHTTSSGFDSQAPDANFRCLADADEKLFSIVVDQLDAILHPVARIGKSFALRTASFLDLDDQTRLQLQHQYVQVDISVFPFHRFQWHYFMHCHGDTWSMLGPSLRRVGLVMTDIGLCVCSPLIAVHHRKRSRLALTNDPEAAMDFLGLDSAVFWGQDRGALRRSDDARADGIPAEFQRHGGPQGHFTPHGRSFATEAELFAFVASSRFFDKNAYSEADLKATDRRRLALRPAYARFVRDFVPTVEPAVGPLPTREDTLNEALDRFKKRYEYVEKERLWSEERELLDQKRQAREHTAGTK